MMRISSVNFRMIAFGLAVIAVSFQVMDQRGTINRMMSIPAPTHQGYASESEASASVARDRDLQEKIDRLEVVLKENTKQERLSAEQRKHEENQQALQTKQEHDIQELKKKIDLLKAELEEKTKQERIAAEELKKAQEKQLKQAEEIGKKPAGMEVQELLRPKSCSAILQRMHDWNDCWRRHVMTSNGEPWKTDVTCQIPLESGNKTQIVTEKIGAPMYQFAYYAGQGFGQFVQHMNQVCMFAFLLKRPCLMNKAPRDPYNNWGSFIADNTYHWDPSALHAIPEYANQLEELAMKLPKMGHGMWGGIIDSHDYEKPESLVFPMNTKFEKGAWGDTIRYYSGENDVRGNKVLFGPNWGDAWSTPLGTVLERVYGCDHQIMSSMMQNAMFGPTDLSLQLHQERYERADATVWNPKEKAKLYNERKNTKAPVSGQLNPAVRTGPHLSATTGTAEGIPTYGTIHLRMLMISGRARKGQPPIETAELADVITSCLQRARELMGKSEFPDNWWIIADNAPSAVEVAEEFHKRGQEGMKKSSLPALKIFHDYEEIAAEQQETKTKGGFQMPSSHSLSRAATGMYGHANMAGSIMDWVALHESKVSMVTGDTGYGTSGSRGKGKSVAAYCGSGKPDNKKQIFKLLI